MAKELPYFRFTVQDWQNGKISLESFELQGLFISISGYYWINDCSLTLTMLHKKFSNAKNLIKELIDLQIIKHEIKHDKIEIEFLNIQYDLLSENRKARQSAGSKGGKAKAMLKQKPSYKDKDKDNNKDKDKDKDKDISINDIKLYFFENGYSEISAQKFFDYYSIANLKDSKGNKVKNWKQKAQAVWFKDENKIKDTNSPLKMVY